MVVLRSEFGGVLRDVRQQQGRTLRDVSRDARVSLGYLSEVERGQKEASSEMLSAICEALDTPLSTILREVTDRVTVAEQAAIPDTIPADFYAGLLSRDGTWHSRHQKTMRSNEPWSGRAAGPERADALIGV